MATKGNQLVPIAAVRALSSSALGCCVMTTEVMASDAVVDKPMYTAWVDRSTRHRIFHCSVGCEKRNERRAVLARPPPCPLDAFVIGRGAGREIPRIQRPARAKSCHEQNLLLEPLRNCAQRSSKVLFLAGSRRLKNR